MNIYLKWFLFFWTIPILFFLIIFALIFEYLVNVGEPYEKQDKDLGSTIDWLIGLLDSFFKR